MPFRARGCVREDESDRPLEGLLVRAYDHDLVVDDHLGDARTDAEGRFEVVYTEAQFQDFHETEPDLYLRIFDASGERLLHTTETRRSATRDEHFEVRIGRAQIAGG
jgi:carotenoid cleavage dioxygenase